MLYVCMFVFQFVECNFDFVLVVFVDFQFFDDFVFVVFGGDWEIEYYVFWNVVFVV